jgi:xylulokinase
MTASAIRSTTCGHGIRQILDTTASAAGRPARIVAVGGGTQGGLWTQVVSDITGREQFIPAQTIGAAYGSALLAGIGSGLLPAETDWSRIEGTVTPDVRHTELYAELYQTYLELDPATRRQVRRLAALAL